MEIHVEAVNGTPIKSLSKNPEISSNGVPTAIVNGDANGAIDVPSPVPSTPKKDNGPRKPRGPTKAQQLNALYSMPLPLKTYPLPTFVPHNPLSILQVLYTWVSQYISPPSSHPATIYYGIYSPSLRAVHITEPTTIRALWERGFYGKGSLSRSELSWLDREKRRIGEGATKTSEEVTRQRRAERQQVKWERARIQQEAIEAKRKEEELVAAGIAAHSEPANAMAAVAPTDPQSLLSLPNSLTSSAPESVAGSADEEDNAVNEKETEEPKPQLDLLLRPIVPIATPSIPKHPTCSNANSPSKSVRFSPRNEHKSFLPSEPIIPADNSASIQIATPSDAEELPLVIKDKEHLQLTTEEAFFLHYGLGVLSVINPASRQPYSTTELFNLFRRSSYFPVQTREFALRPDDAFMLNYVVYHHFRALGWVVRGGVKFGVDYLLYNRGPVFTHAEFAVIILPSYSDPYWHSDDPTLEYPGGRRGYVEGKLEERGKWSWLHAVNRVNAQVKKTCVLVYVDVPPPIAMGGTGEEKQIHRQLKKYRVREVVVRRWVSNRSRD